MIAKQLDAVYKPGERKGMVKVKRVRTIDCVIVGWRPGKEKGTVGSLILGLYDKKGKLIPIGHTSGLKAKEKKALVKELKPYETGEKGSGDPSRWDSDRELEWYQPPAGAGGRGHLRPHQRRPDPTWVQDHALARRQEAARLHDRSARLTQRPPHTPGETAPRMWGQTWTSQSAEAISIGMAIVTVTSVAASS